MVIAKLFLGSNVTLHDATSIRDIAIQMNHAVINGDNVIRICIATMLLEKGVPTVQVATIEQWLPTGMYLKVSTADCPATRLGQLLCRGATCIRLRVSAPCSRDRTEQPAYDYRDG
jgi:hypothetical protein